MVTKKEELELFYEGELIYNKFTIVDWFIKHVIDLVDSRSQGFWIKIQVRILRILVESTVQYSNNFAAFIVNNGAVLFIP